MALEKRADGGLGRIEGLHEKTVTILGSTGSVGCSTVDLLERYRDLYRVVALTANNNVTALVDQAKRLQPELVAIGNERHYSHLRQALSGTGIEVVAGLSGLKEAAQRPASWVMAAIVGAAGLEPTLEAVRRGCEVALANKECLVSAGPLFMAEICKSGATLLSVDSEHNAIFQVLDQHNPSTIETITLTATGGPFRTASWEQMRIATPAQAVAHPQWDMGAKISVDSATMMNKGLELIEAYHLFPVEERQLDVIVHPEAIVHSMVAYRDGSVLAQLGTPDMRIPIASALAWPHRIETPVPRLRLTEIRNLTFAPPDFSRFPALSLARHALQRGGSLPTILNAANEVAVQAFLEKKIGFLDIYRVVESVLGCAEREPSGENRCDTLDSVARADKLARNFAGKCVKNCAA